LNRQLASKKNKLNGQSSNDRKCCDVMCKGKKPSHGAIVASADFLKVAFKAMQVSIETDANRITTATASAANETSAQSIGLSISVEPANPSQMGN
jgi:hypothetical protein